MKNKVLIFIAFIITWQMMALQIVSAQNKDLPTVRSISKKPLIYGGNKQPDKRFYDGRLPHAIGVHSFQAFRANRTHPANPGPQGLGWTYNHQPYLAYWNGKFYMQFLSNPMDEHGPPGHTSIMTSKDGQHWSMPKVVFPEYTLPKFYTDQKEVPAGTKAVMHQRMGFYVGPNGRLLTSGFYGLGTWRHSPNKGDGIGRAVREIYKDGSLGPLYFILFNKYAGHNAGNANYPYFKESNDAGFIAACDSLLANPLMRLQWWEEQRGQKNFFPIDPSKNGTGKAFNFFHRSDGVVIGTWKSSYAALSTDEGQSWTPVVRNKSLRSPNSKIWGERLNDGRYALVYDHSATLDNRFPLVAITSDDAHKFKNMAVVQGQVPPIRYQGLYKNAGPQYVRGITEGNGNPPGGEMWVTYSINKEDIWVSKVSVPISNSVDAPVNQSFDKISSLSDLPLWNFYVPQWAPVSIVKQQSDTENHYLELRDEDPYDYALAERNFPPERKATIQFKVNPKQVTRGHALEVNVSNERGERALRLRFSRHWLSFSLKEAHVEDPTPIDTDQWHNIKLNIDCDQQTYTVIIGGSKIEDPMPFGSDIDHVSRITFRTGPYRNYVPSSDIDGDLRVPGLNIEDQPGADEKVLPTIYWIDDLRTK